MVKAGVVRAVEISGGRGDITGLWLRRKGDTSGVEPNNFVVLHVT